MQTFDLSEDSKAILLLCGVFGGKDKGGGAKPLKLNEYNRVVSVLVEKKLRPRDILNPEILSDLKRDLERKIEFQRIADLLKRGASLAFSTERWINKGIWVITRGDDIYPQKLKKRLNSNSPPILFGIGDISLFNIDGLAVVGSRNVDAEGEKYTSQIGSHCAKNGIPIVSGGARGVDQIAINAALLSNGTAIGVLADSLMRSSVSKNYRDAIVDHRLLLISPFNPEARFNVGNAMGRNKYIYSLSCYALVISAEKGKGGTWAGATEELKRKSGFKVFVRSEGTIPRGNYELIKLGALPFPKQPWNNTLLEVLKNIKISDKMTTYQTSFFDDIDENSKQNKELTQITAKERILSDKAQVDNDFKKVKTIYDVVLPLMLDQMNEWITIDELAKVLCVRKGQLQDWISTGLKMNQIQKKNRPVQYKRHDNKMKNE